jgi:hypothetical protein
MLHIKARIAEEAGACAVMALERVPADIRSEGNTHHLFLSKCFTFFDPGGVARMVSCYPFTRNQHHD